MVKKVMIHMNMFSLNQAIYLSHEDGKIEVMENIPTDELSKTIYNLVGPDNQIEEIELDGPSSYIQKYGFDILEGLEKNYSDRNVRIYLNGEIFNQ